MDKKIQKARDAYCAEFGMDPFDLCEEDWTLILWDVENAALLMA